MGVSVKKASAAAQPGPGRAKSLCILFLALSAVIGCALLHRFIKASAFTVRDSSARADFHRAAFGAGVTVRASASGNPPARLTDGRGVMTSYAGAGAAVEALAENQAQPLALASADFDEDGVPDLVGGYGGTRTGIITMHRGNVDSIYPNSPEAQRRRAGGSFTDAPFLSPARVFESPEFPDLIGAGDFDADGHRDVVIAARGSRQLYLFRGDGRGGLADPGKIPLPGAITALVTGEINRRDGLDDLVIGITGEDGAKALVFQGPQGALKATAQVFSLPARAASFALGQFDDGFEMDLAVAAGSKLLIISGRDRQQSPGGVVKDGGRPFTSSLRSIAAGNFTGNEAESLAVLRDDGTVEVLSRRKQKGQGIRDWKSKTSGSWPRAKQLARARVFALPGDDLMVMGGDGHQLQIISPSPERQTSTTGDKRQTNVGNAVATLEAEGEPVAALPMRLNVHASNSLVMLTSGSSNPSVLFQQGGGSTFVVNTTNDNGDNVTPTPGSLRQAILDSNASPGIDTINFSIGTGQQTIIAAAPLPTITDPAIIDGTTQPGYAGSPIIELSGSGAGPGAIGLEIVSGSSTVRGLVINQFSGTGIKTHSGIGNIIEGNYIGTDVSGTTARGNGAGVRAEEFSSPRIGGTTASARNLISGNVTAGIILGTQGFNNTVQGNLIGTDVTGAAALGNSDGVHINESVQDTIGGTTAGAGNVISANTNRGIIIHNNSNTAIIQGNYIGTDSSGTADLGNANSGVNVSGFNHTIGGTAAGAGNIIAFTKSGPGVAITIGTDNPILSNSIFSNAGLGIDLNGDGVTPDDGGDGDGGANNLQNSPVLSSVSSSVGSTNITGTLNSAVGTVFRIEFFANDACDSSGFGEGQTFLGWTNVSTDGSGNAAFNVMLPVAVSGGQSVTATATDPDNNTSEFSECFVLCSLTCPANITTTAAAGSCGAVVNYPPPTTSGSCGAVNCAPVSGSTFAVGVTMVNCNSGGGPGCSFTVTVNDTQPPSITCPSDITQSNDPGQCSAVVNYTVPTATDNCSGATVDCFPSSGSAFQVGAVLVTCTAVDASNNITNCAFGVIINDTETPTITCPADQTATALPGQNSAAVNYNTPQGSDNCAGQITNCAPPAGSNFPVGVTSVTCTTTDSSNNAKSCSFNVTVNQSPTVSINDVSIIEGNSTATASFTVSLSSVSALTVTVAYATADGTAIAGSDYAAASGILTFNPGEITQSVAVQIIGDVSDEPDENFFVTLSDPDKTAITDDRGAGVIVNDDAAPTIIITDAGVVEGNSGTVNAVFLLTLFPVSGKPVTVSYATADADASSGSDYVPASGTLAFDPGEAGKFISIQVKGDTVDEANETFLVKLSEAKNARLLGPAAVGTILDDDQAPSLSIRDASGAEGKKKKESLEFTVALSAISEQQVKVSFATADGTATAGSDYVPASGTLVFKAGEKSKTVEVELADDTTDEADETFFVNLFEPVNATIADGQGLGTIKNDDAIADLSVEISSKQTTVPSAGRMTYLVAVRNSGPATATGVLVANNLPAATTLASILVTEGDLEAPPVGVNGNIRWSIDSIAAGEEARLEMTINVLAPSNTTLLNVVKVTSISTDPKADNDTASNFATVLGGAILQLVWDQPPQTVFDPVPGPVNVRTTPGGSPDKAAPSDNAAPVFAPALSLGLLEVECELLRVDIYIITLNPQPGDTTPGQLFLSVPPGTTRAQMPTPPEGCFYRVVDVWKCNEAIQAIPSSNDPKLPPGPLLGEKIKVSSQIKITGRDFKAPVGVLINALGFEQKAKLNGDRTEVTQKGNLADGRSIEKIIADEKQVFITVANSDGGLATRLYVKK